MRHCRFLSHKRKAGDALLRVDENPTRAEIAETGKWPLIGQLGIPEAGDDVNNGFVRDAGMD